MKINRSFSARFYWRALAMASSACLLGTSVANAATTDVQVWYSLNPHNKQVFEKLVKQFNGDQNEVRVKLKSFDFPEAIEAALPGTVKTKNIPHLVQLDDNRAPEEIANLSYILPLHTLLAKHPIKDAKWFLSNDNTFMHDSRGRLLAFPYMAEIPVMYYNTEAFKKAGINPAVPARSWRGLQDQLVNLANKATRQCPLTSDLPVSVNLENLAAVNNQYFASAENGLKVKGLPAFSFDVMYVRHLSVMISWVRSELMVKPALESKSTERFANNECGVLISESGSMGWFKKQRSLNFGVSGLPYYSEITKKPGNPFVDGAAFWATDGHSKAEDKATAAFLGWLAQPKNAATWYQETGFLPLTDQAFAMTDNGYYQNMGDWKNLVAAHAAKPAPTDRGFRINNYPKIKAMFRQSMDRALSGEQSAVVALKFASTQAAKLMREHK